MKVVTLLLTLAFIFLGPAITVLAYVSSSDNYRLDADSLNSASASTTSSTYRMDGTVGETTTGPNSSSNYHVDAGYQYMVPGPLSLSVGADVTLTPTISAVSGGQANGRTSWRIASHHGFSFYVSGSGKVLRSTAGAFTNYSGITLTWQPASGVPTFGFNPFGTYSHENYWSDSNSIVPSGSCGFNFGQGSPTDGVCWDGFSEGGKLIGQASSGPTDDTLYLNLRADYRDPVSGRLPAGNYQANITATLIGS